MFLLSLLLFICSMFEDLCECVWVIGLWGVIVVIVVVVGLVLGGVLVDIYGWCSVFLINVLLGVVGMLGIWVIVCYV